MVKLYKPKSTKRLDSEQLTLTIERLDLNGDGVARYQGKPVFVSAALPNEIVQAKVIEQKSKYLRAQAKQIKQASSKRVEPQCSHFYQCGGCNLQHLDYPSQLAFKQQKVSELFKRHCQLEQLPWQAPLVGLPWHYRRKARIGVQYDKKQQLTLGFRKKQSNVLTAIKECPVLPERISVLLQPLQQLLQQLTPAKSIGHCEFIHARDDVLLLRTLSTLDANSKLKLREFAERYQLRFVIHDGQHIRTLEGQLADALHVSVDDCQLTFAHTDFLQVNEALNNEMVRQAIDWLDIQKSDTVLDLFCGFGNFSLPIAKRCQQVVGVEGVDAMVSRANFNAQHNALQNCQFYQADLNDEAATWPWLEDYEAGAFNKVLLDPARAGAPGAIRRIVKMSPAAIVYVSCDPATMSRDCAQLLEANYTLSKIAIMDMFAQTRHVETMALFIKKG